MPVCLFEALGKVFGMAQLEDQFEAGRIDKLTAIMKIIEKCKLLHYLILTIYHRFLKFSRSSIDALALG